jgi:hypothetical protein
MQEQMPKRVKADDGLGNQQSIIKSADRSVQAPKSFIRMEKNLSSIGFFSATEKNEKRSTQARVINADGRKTTILPSPNHGLPNTSDQDKFFALLHLVEQIRWRQGSVSNPISFSTMEIVKIMGLAWSGRLTEEIAKWLQRMVVTSIMSEGAIYLVKKKRHISDTFHAFTRVITAGETLDNGAVADRHLVWMSEWLLDNVNQGYVLPIEMESYKRLGSSLARVLVPHLQAWLYSSRERRRFEKRYKPFCEICGLTPQKYLSKAKGNIQLAMEELRRENYIANWDIVHTQDGQDFKIVLEHGRKFYDDLASIGSKPEPTKEIAEPEVEERLPPAYDMLLARNISRQVALRMVREKSREDLELLVDKMEYYDWLIGTGKWKPRNPPGAYIRYLQSDDLVPESFISSKRLAQSEAQQELAIKSEHQTFLMKEEYKQYVSKCVDEAIRKIDPEELQKQRKKLASSIRGRYRNLDQKQIDEIAEAEFRKSLRESLPVPLFEDFILLNGQMNLF